MKRNKRAFGMSKQRNSKTGTFCNPYAEESKFCIVFCQIFINRILKTFHKV